jgi:hypothetical protein
MRDNPQSVHMLRGLGSFRSGAENPGSEFVTCIACLGKVVR